MGTASIVILLLASISANALPANNSSCSSKAVESQSHTSKTYDVSGSGSRVSSVAANGTKVTAYTWKWLHSNESNNAGKGNTSDNSMRKYFLDGQQKYLKCGENQMVMHPNTLHIMKSCYRKTYVVNNATRNEVPKEQKLCPFVCMAQGLGMMKENGKVDRAKVRSFLEVATPVPSSKTQEIIDLVYSCADEHENTIALKPGNCTSAAPFFLCAFEEVLDACGYDAHNLDQIRNKENSSEEEDEPMTPPPPSKAKKN